MLSNVMCIAVIYLEDSGHQILASGYCFESPWDWFFGFYTTNKKKKKHFAFF
jgi:hypothetical protein